MLPTVLSVVLALIAFLFSFLIVLGYYYDNCGLRVALDDALDDLQQTKSDLLYLDDAYTDLQNDLDKRLQVARRSGYSQGLFAGLDCNSDGFKKLNTKVIDLTALTIDQAAEIQALKVKLNLGLQAQHSYAEGYDRGYYEGGNNEMRRWETLDDECNELRAQLDAFQAQGGC
jgi:hypothetical protein